MTFITTCAEQDDLGGGRFRNVHYIKPVAYEDGGTLRAISGRWADSGIAERPHIVTAARLMTSISDEGMRRIHPTREMDRYVEIGTPYVRVGGVWRKVGFRNATRIGNRIMWHRHQADLTITHGGNFVKLEIELLNGYVPEDNLVSFPVGMNGLTRKGSIVYADGMPVMQVRAPSMHDATNPEDVRAIDGRFTTLDGQPYYLMTLPPLKGMIRPVIDPTFTTQPDAAAGMDTAISEGHPTYNAGINTGMSCGYVGWGNFRALLQFSLSGLPAGNVLTAAVLTLACELATDSSDVYVTAHRALTQWYEGNKDYAALDAGVNGSTWNLRNNNGSVAWAGGAGGGRGTDYTATGAANVITATGTYTWNVLDDIHAWYDGSASNYGWWLINASEDIINSRKRFTTSDGTKEADRPKLVVTYSAPSGGGFPKIAGARGRTRM